jgi:hypothetical protein
MKIKGKEDIDYQKLRKGKKKKQHNRMKKKIKSELWLLRYINIVFFF